MFFTANFQVIKVDSPYNMLLGRPWLHVASAIASTLHQRLKLPSEESLTFFKETSVPCIGATEATFRSFELVSTISRAPKLKSAWPFATLGYDPSNEELCYPPYL